MHPIELIREFYPSRGKTLDILLSHSESVAQKALSLVDSSMGKWVDIDFIWDSAMLHDIGIFMTDSPKLGCTGKSPYICHGILGRRIVEEAGFPKHGLVCERHVGVGLSVEDIKNQNLPLPHRDMRPRSLEEMLVCYADKFFSKNPSTLNTERNYKEVIDNLSKYGDKSIKKFME